MNFGTVITKIPAARTSCPSVCSKCDVLKKETICSNVIADRGVHGSGLCPTREPTRKRSGSIFSTRNRPVKRVGFRGSVFRRVASVSGEAETRRKTQKNGQNRRYLARSGQDPVRISSNPIIFPPNRVENLWIWCIYAGSDYFGRRNLPNQAENSSESMEN